MSASTAFDASVIRFLLIVFGGLYVAMGVAFWLLRELAETEDTLVYWLIAGREPYILADDQRHEHFVFKSKLTLALGIPLLSIAASTILVSDGAVLEYSPLLALAMGLSFLILHLMFVADAEDRNTRNRDTEVKTEKILEDEDQGKLTD